MCKCIGSIALCLMLLPAALAAQHMSSETAAQLARVDSLTPLWRQSTRSLDSIRTERAAARRRAAQEKLDTLSMAPFVLVTTAADARSTFRDARRVLQPLMPMLEGLDSATALTMLIEAEGTSDALRQLAPRPRHHIVALHQTKSHIRERLMRAAFENALLDLVPDSVRAWAAGEFVSIRNPERQIYRELATAPSALAGRCFARDTRSCIDALGLGTPLDSMRGYTPDELRALAANRAGAGTRRARYDCVEERNISQCLAWFRPWGGPPLPMSYAARGNLLAFALHQGGSGALERLRSTTSSTADALAAATGMSLDDLVTAWRRRIDEAGGTRQAGLVRTALSTLFWIGLLLALSLRSTRMRVS